VINVTCADINDKILHMIRLLEKGVPDGQCNTIWVTLMMGSHWEPPSYFCMWLRPALGVYSPPWVR